MMDGNDSDDSIDNLLLIERAAEVVAAYVGHNTLGPSEIGGLLASVHQTLATLGKVETPVAPKEPAVAIRKSVKPDHVVCIECGNKFKSLRRHLNTHHDLSPAEYRAKWNLPPDYPMVAPDYAAERSRLAKAIGLGQLRRKAQSA